MAKILIILLLHVLISVAYSIHYSSHKNGTNGVCVFNEKNYNPGQEWFTSNCKKWKCVKGNRENEVMLERQQCNNRPGCEAKILPDKKFPDCCTNEFVCDGDDSRRRHHNTHVVHTAGSNYLASVHPRRSADGGNDSHYAKDDQEWKKLDREQAESRKKGEHLATPSSVRPRRSADGGNGTYYFVDDLGWRKEDEDWEDFDR